MMYKNQAGKMGAASSQPAKRKMAMNVDPLERLNHKMAGCTHGKYVEGVAPGMREKRKSSITKNYHEIICQGILFGYYNLHFKTINLPKNQRLTNLCKKFIITLLIPTNQISLQVINLS